MRGSRRRPTPKQPYLVLDSGAVLGESTGKAKIRTYIRSALDRGIPVVVPAIVVTETFRGDPRHVRLNRLLHEALVGEADFALAREAGILLGAAGMSNAADAQVAAEAMRQAPCVLLTGDEQDLRALLTGHTDVTIVNIERL